MVEHNLAKVRVAGSSPVFRSTFLQRMLYKKSRSDGGIGRREGLKIPWPQGCAGSIPAPSTFFFVIYRIAEVAQLVEHNLAKVRVAGSSPVFRSNEKSAQKALFFMRYQTPPSPLLLRFRPASRRRCRV